MSQPMLSITWVLNLHIFTIFKNHIEIEECFAAIFKHQWQPLAVRN